jgi:hypothetical protein
VACMFSFRVVRVDKMEGLGANVVASRVRGGQNLPYRIQHMRRPAQCLVLSTGD